MIRGAAAGCARLLFGLACVALIVAALLGYGAWRAARVAVAGRPPLPKRDAGFAVLLALVQLARTLPHDTPRPERIEP